MHTGPMKGEGTFDPWTSVNVAGPPYQCRRCGSGLGLRFRTWESNCGGYEDVKFQCIPCGHVWWVDGIDS